MSLVVLNLESPVGLLRIKVSPMHAAVREKPRKIYGE
jgi:hypothetical protein